YLGEAVTRRPWGASLNQVSGNYIGTNSNGRVALGNVRAGVWIGQDAAMNQIGGASSSERNVISGNGSYGIAIEGASNNMVTWNFIGVNKDGNVELHNGRDGIFIIGNNTQIERNLISGNGTLAQPGNGISVTGDHNVIRRNVIGSNSQQIERIPNQGY